MRAVTHWHYSDSLARLTTQPQKCEPEQQYDERLADRHQPLAKVTGAMVHYG